MKVLFYTLAVSFFFAASGKEPAPESAKWKRPESTTIFKLSNRVSENYDQKIVVISNRYFDPATNSFVLRGVHPKRELFYFVLTQHSDTAVVTKYPDLESAMKEFSGENKFLLFVNGHGKTFEQVVERGFQVGGRYNTNMIMFDWPTEYYAIRKTISNSRKVTNNFVEVTGKLNEILKASHSSYSASVIFHSMGNRIIKKAVQRDLLRELPEDVFDNLILNAAAVKQKGHRKWVNQLDIQKQIYIVSNEGDVPLMGVKMMRFARQLGSGYETPIAKNATYINFSEIATKEHNAFLGLTPVEKEHPNIYNFYHQVFNSEQVDLLNTENYAKGNQSGIFYIM